MHLHPAVTFLVNLGLQENFDSNGLLVFLASYVLSVASS